MSGVLHAVTNALIVVVGGVVFGGIGWALSRRKKFLQPHKATPAQRALFRDGATTRLQAGLAEAPTTLSRRDAAWWRAGYDEAEQRGGDFALDLVARLDRLAEVDGQA